jgi:L-arabinokinase
MAVRRRFLCIVSPFSGLCEGATLCGGGRSGRPRAGETADEATSAAGGSDHTPGTGTLSSPSGQGQEKIAERQEALGKATLVAYVTGHGFGHATRTAEVLREVHSLAPATEIRVVTSAPARLFHGALGAQVHVRAAACDVGLAQHDALTIDERGTLARWREFAAVWPARVGEEARWLRAVGARVVLADVPPLAFAAAREAGVPALALANFSWDEVYAHLARRHPALGEAAAQAAEAYRAASLLLELPFALEMPAFARRERIPLVARRPRVGRAEARRRLRLGGRPAVLLTFGGLGLPGFRGQVLAGLPEFDFLVSEPVRSGPAHVRPLAADVGELGLGYEDVVGAVDVVVTKPGYGIVSDAIAARTRLVYTERGDFPEYAVLVREMGRYLPAVHVTNGDLWAGRLRGPLEDALARPFPPEADLSGALVAARRVLGT